MQQLSRAAAAAPSVAATLAQELMECGEQRVALLRRAFDAVSAVKGDLDTALAALGDDDGLATEDEPQMGAQSKEGHHTETCRAAPSAAASQRGAASVAAVEELLVEVAERRGNMVKRVNGIMQVRLSS